MTANQASPARAGLPAAQAATARPHPTRRGHPAICCRPADLPLAAARKQTALAHERRGRTQASTR